MDQRNKTKKRLKKAIKSINISVKDSHGVIHTYYRRSKRRSYGLLRNLSQTRFALKVVYLGGYENKSAWYDNKKELMNAFRCFTEQPLVEEFLNE